ncbi:site-specific integrase [Mycobacterium sp. SVM_VP21]|nr:site-specific integrase [Mycobacterium sp. SVM_VP21]
MAWIKADERADGTTAYRVFYRREGRQTTLTLDTAAAAETFRTAIDQLGVRAAEELYRVRRVVRPQRGITVAEWTRTYLDHRTAIEKKTKDDYERYLANDIAPTIGDIELAKLTENDLAVWLSNLETTPRAKTGRPPSAKTIRNLHGFLSASLNAAIKAGHLGFNPAAGRKLPRRTAGDREDRAEMRMLTRVEFAALRDAATDYWRPLIEFMVVAGCRWGEVSALKPSDVDRDAQTVRIVRAWKYSSSGYEIGTTKTTRSKRVINVPGPVLDKLDYSHEWLFVNRAGGPVRYHGFRPRVWDKAVARAKLSPPPTPHDLRHTCASWMIAQGVPIAVVSRHLGHENIQITVDTYGDVERASFAAAADAVAKMLE